MAKIVAGAALIAGAVALDVFSAGIMASATSAEMAAFDFLITSGTVVGAVGSAGASMLLSGIADAMHANNTGQQAVSSQQPIRPWRIVYGRRRVSGSSIDLSLSDGGNGDNRWLWQVQVLAAHRVQSILATYLNQQQPFVRTGTNGLTGNLIGSSITDGGNMNVPGMVLEMHPVDLNFRTYSNFYWDGNPRFWQALYDGTQKQADPYYMALCATGGAGTPHWDSTCIVEGMAYAINRYWANSHWSAGLPNVRYDVEGKNDIYDPRSGATGYTENAALVLADYMCNQQYGMLMSIADFDSDTLIAAANICDETVALTNAQTIFNTQYTSEARYTCNGTLSTSEQGGQVMQQMLAAMAGRITYAGGKYYIFPGVYQGTSGITVGEADLTGDLTWKPTRKSRDLFNEVRATFICPSGWDTTYAPGFDVYNVTSATVENTFNGQWNSTDAPPFCFNALRNYSTDPYLLADQNVKYIHTTNLPYTISVAAAQRLSKIMLLRNRYQGTGSIKLPIRYLGVMANDIIEVSYPRFGWVNKQLEVQNVHIDLGGADGQGVISPPTLTVDVAEVDVSIYTWSAADELKLEGGQSVAGSTLYDLAPPTNLVLESGNVQMKSGNGSTTAKSAILCTWVPSNDVHVQSGGFQIIDYQVNGATYWINAARVPGDQTQFLIHGVSDGTAYNVRLRCVTQTGYSTDYVQAGPITVSDSVVTVSASDTYYSDGKAVALLEPAMAGADITESLTTVFVSNPGFEAGNTGWGYSGDGPSIVNLPAYAHSGSWAFQTQGTLGTSAEAANNSIIPVKPGQVINAQCMINAALASGGYASVRVLCLDGSKNLVKYIDGAIINAGTSGYTISSIVAVCPPGTAYAQLALSVAGQTGGTYFFDDCHMAFQATTLDEVPNGPGFGKIGIGSIFQGVNRPLIDLSDPHTNKTLDYVDNGATYSRTLGSQLTNGQIDLTLNYLNKNIDNIPDGATYARLLSNQLSGNALDFNLPYSGKGALATVNQVTNSQLQNGGVFGVGGASVGSTAYTSVTNQDLPLNSLFNSWFEGTPGDGVGLASNADAQPPLPSGSGLGLWGPYNSGYGQPVWYGQGIVLMTSTSTSSQPIGICNYVQAAWVGAPGDPFVLSVQAAWASTTQPNGGFIIIIEPYGSSGTDPASGISGSFPATAFSSTQFQMAVLEGTLPPLSSGYDQGWVVIITHNATSGEFLVEQPMLASASIVSTWTAQYPISPRYAATAPSSAPPTTTYPSGGSGSPTSGSGYCPTFEMLLRPGISVADASPGWLIDCVDTATWQRYEYPIEAMGFAQRECVRLTTANGAQLEVSVETPFTLVAGSMVTARDMLGKLALTDTGLDSEPEWSQVVNLEYIGQRPVCLLSVGGRTFAAGKGERRIYSHNQRKPPIA